MKRKEYVQPDLQVINIESCSLIATSPSDLKLGSEADYDTPGDAPEYRSHFGN